MNCEVDTWEATLAFVSSNASIVWISTHQPTSGDHVENSSVRVQWSGLVRVALNVYGYVHACMYVRIFDFVSWFLDIE